ncbi:MAG: response regulator [Proteobacteria bacterium]|nr:response regulator [Pseudomonadota bacterium]
MLDVDLDGIFEELEDKDARELRFMEHLAVALPTTYFQLHKDGGKVFCAGRETTPRVGVSSEVLDHLRQHGKFPDAQGVERVCPVVIDELDAVLFCWLPETMASYVDDPFVAEVVRAAVGQVQALRAAEAMDIENQQLSKQIGAMKAQHFELVENNHRQYLQLQEKDRNYASNLEAEIAQRTVDLRKANEELKEASRLKSEFLANMSHELRTPMNAIIGFSALLSESQLNPEQADYALTIKQSGDGLLSLINDILDFSKIEAGKLDISQELFSLPDIIKNVSAMFAKSSRDKGVAFRYEIGEDVPANLIGDGHRLKQVLINLAGNAMKFTKEGEVAIVISLVQAQEQVKVRFLVFDTGIGIPFDKQSAIFEKFTQADGSITRNYGGTGLGLAITCQLVGLMGGNVTLCSEVGVGSIFGFVLPFVVAEQTVAKQGAVAPQELSDGVVLRILLVEDNVVNQKLATILIKREGCEVVVAGDGVKALEALQVQEFDLILMDLQMPNMDGMEATRRIRALEACEERNSYLGLKERLSPVPIVGLSAHARKEDADEAKGAGMNDFLTKPIVRAKLVEVIRQIKSGEIGR